MSFDGHYWVVRDGKIIDPMFRFYEEDVKLTHDLIGEPIYLPADPLTQKVFKKKQEEKMKNQKDWGFYTKDWKMKLGYCDTNAYHEQQLRGGEIVFGSMGWKRNDGEGIHYEYGGVGWTTAQFMKKI